MLRVHQLEKSLGRSPLLRSVSFTALSGERIGLIGPRNSGKTCLLRILAGEEKQYSGIVQFIPTGQRIGHYNQTLKFNPKDRLEDYLIHLEGDIAALSSRLAELAKGLANHPSSSMLKQAYELVSSRLEQATENAARAPAVLQGLGLDNLPSETPVASLTHGQKMRLALASVLVINPHILLLDEPTEHLDQKMITWLEEWLLRFKGLAIIVSNNCPFHNRVATSIMEIDPQEKTIRRRCREAHHAQLATDAASSRPGL